MKVDIANLVTLIEMAKCVRVDPPVARIFN